MNENHSSEKEFSFTIETFEDSGGQITYQTIVVNREMPLQIVILRLRAFLKKLEQIHYDTLEDSTTFLNS